MFLALLLPVPTPDHLNPPPFLFVQCHSLTLWDPLHIDSNYFTPLWMSTSLWFCLQDLQRFFFSYLVPKFCFTTTLWSKEGVGFHSPLIGKENEAQRHLLGRDTEGAQRAHWLLVQCSFLMPHCLLSREANCLEPEGTWRDISSISQWGNKDSEKWQHLGDFPRPSLSLPSFHLSHSEASIWAASMYIGCTLQEIWEMVFELRTLTNNPESSGSHITYWEQLKAT